MRVRGFAICIVCGLATYGWANESALNIMPIADVMGHREAVLGYGVASTESDKRWFSAYYVQLGLYDKVELGWDNDFLGSTVWNGKVKLWDKSGTALSAGIANVSDRTRPDYYVTGRYDWSNVRFHTAWRQWGGVDRGMFGFDCEVAPGLVGLFDHIGGNGEYTWFGLSYELSAVPGLAITGSYGRPNRKADGDQTVITATYGFRF